MNASAAPGRQKLDTPHLICMACLTCAGQPSVGRPLQSAHQDLGMNLEDVLAALHPKHARRLWARDPHALWLLLSPCMSQAGLAPMQLMAGISMASDRGSLLTEGLWLQICGAVRGGPAQQAGPGGHFEGDPGTARPGCGRGVRLS